MPSFFAHLSQNTDFPHSEEFDDRYYLDGLGLYESQCVYLRNQQLLENHVMHKGPFIVGEIGFGSGLNFLALFDLWNKSQHPHGPLVYVSFEQYPLHPRDLRSSLRPWEKQLSEPISRLLGHYRSPTPGLNFFFFGPENILLILVVGEASEQLRKCHFQAHHWMLDGFAPAKNPSAWSDSLFAGVSKLSAPGASLETFTAAGFVARGLSSYGWAMTKGPGFGRKRHRLSGIMTHAGSQRVTPASNIMVFGSGIAGRSLAFFSHWLGSQPQIISCPGPSASEIPYIYSHFKPRRLWDWEQIFHVQTHQFSGHFFKDLGKLTDISYAPAPLLADSALKSDVQKRFEKASQDPRFSEILQRGHGGWLFPHGFSIDGYAALSGLTDLCGMKPQEMTFTDARHLLAECVQHQQPIALACSFTMPSLLKGFPEPAILRGEMRPEGEHWSKPTHERHHFNPSGNELRSVVGFRAHSQGHLPLYGLLAEGQGCFSAYHGSKGFSSAPWCGLLLALQMAQIFSYDCSGCQSATYSLQLQEK